jgi:hypothetical protein
VRTRQVALRSESGSEVALASPEDVVIHKPRRFEMGGRVSDRQWQDASSCMKADSSRGSRNGTPVSDPAITVARA